MSAICQTFVQNAWRKDLCSNCFKSKDEHGGPGKAGVQRQPSRGPGDLSDGKRYMGVAGSAYQRSYYGQNAWKSIMIDHNESSSSLKSPGLIKGVNLVTHENEKNLKLNNDLKADVGGESKVEAPSLRGSSLLQSVRSAPSEAKLLSELLGDPSEKPKDKADVSSDLGSDASNDSTSSSSSEGGANSGSDGLGAHSDTASVRSDAGSEAATYKGGVTPPATAAPPPPQGILKDFSLVKSRKGPITFGPVDEIIGYGGDVDYSDDDDDYLDDDDDDDDSVASLELTIDERIVRRITQRNTDFNGENENLEEDTLVPEDAKLTALLKQAERLREEEEEEEEEEDDAMDMEAEDADEEDEGEEEMEETSPKKGPNPTAAPRLSKQKVEDKPEGRVKLKRSPPLVSVKPFITRSSSSDPRVNQVLPMKNGEVVRPGHLSSSSEEVLGVDGEDVPLKGIKPKYVALEDEMKEKSFSDEEKESGKGKVTAIDDICPPRLQRLERIEEKVTRLDDVVPIQKETVTRLDDPAPPLKEVVNTKDVLAPLQTKEVLTKRDDTVPPQKEAVVERMDKVVPVKKEVVSRSDAMTRTVVTKKDSEVPGDKKGVTKSGKEVEREVVNRVESATSKQSETSRLEKVVSSEKGHTRLDTKLPSEREVVMKMDNVIKSVHDVVTSRDNVTKNVTNNVISAEPFKDPEVREKPSPKERNQSASSERCTNVRNVGDAKNRDDRKKESPVMVPPAAAPDLPKDPPPATLPSIQPKQDFSRKESTASISSSSTSEDTRSSSETGTRSSHSSAEASKTPASRQSSSSSGLSTFGTPVVLNSQSPQNSFLHSSRSMRYEDPYNSPNAIYAPATNFLKDIKSQPEVVTQTAGIQKSALYASTSCLKGLPGAKPVITPKPPILKDKPKVPLKPGMSTSRIYATPSPIVPKVPMGSLSGAMSTPNLALPPQTLERQVSSDSASASSEVSHRYDLEETSPSQMTPTATTTKPSGRDLGAKHSEPPTTPAPPTPTMTSTPARQSRDIPEVVYETPSPIVSTAATATSTATRVDCRASVISVACPDKDVDEASIYSEITETQGEGGRPQQQESSSTTPRGSGVDLGSDSPSSFTRQESTRAQARSTFEANRSFLSTSLDFGTRATRSSSSKRQAPKPPREEGGEGAAAAADEGAEATPTSNSTFPPKDHQAPPETTEAPETQETPNSLAPPLPDNKDGESYSSFTDDFDDEEDDDYEDEQREHQFQPLRRTERSSSATPMYRNSIGPSITYDPSGYNGHHQVHPDPSMGGFSFPRPGQPGAASRSQSVPRSSDHIVVPPAAAASGGSATTSSSSSSGRFGFSKSGFFRPSSPSTSKRDASDRGRDRTKKSSSKFSLKKLLRFGGKDEDKKAAKEQAEKKVVKADPVDKKAAEREAKKNKLQIIHPLDYNQNGVEVIARPQKMCPLYDYSGLYGYIPPPKQLPSPQIPKKLQQEAAGDNNVVLTKATPLSTSVEPIYAPSPVQAPPTMAAPSPAPSLSSKRSERSEDSYGQVSGYSNSSQNSNSQTPFHAGQDKRTSIVRKESLAEARPGSAQHLGYNSEGRPKPPPPPRKASLEAQQSGFEGYAELAPPSTPTSRPQRPPPPHHGGPPRTPSSSSTSGSALNRAGPPRPDPPRLGKDSVYANLGDVRAPITPRKPGRSASLRGDDDREKRRAPQPPYAQGGDQPTGPAGGRNGKGPAPSRPQSHYQTVSSGYGIPQLQRSSSPALYDLPLPCRGRGAPPEEEVEREEVTCDGYIVPQQALHAVATTHNIAPEGSSSSSLASASSSRPDKTSRLSVRRGSALLHRTLEDQYGAVVSANLHALSNLLEQLSQRRVPSGYEEIEREVSRWADIELGDAWATEGVAGRRYYPGTACGSDVTVMITPEVKLEAHYLLTPLPIASFKDHVPSELVSAKGGHVPSSVPATVWVLPRLRVSSLLEYAAIRRSHRALSTVSWHQEVCLLVLQLVTALKHLQAQSVEEISIDLVLVAYGGSDADPRMLVLPPSHGAEQASRGLMSLCRCAIAAMYVLLGVEGAVEKAQRDYSVALPSNVEMHAQLSALVGVLRQERAGSLSKVKCALEFLLWGPEDLSSQGAESEDQEATLQRWLDLERATVLHSLIKKVPEPQVAVTYNLLFLVRSNARVLREAASLLQEPEVTMF
ncbi:uncharacterized protein LOC143029629 isoform X2 [Oratosquilla oratoria]|uniref:uncharacterized protein LOC143029629 isoform X2 n=1 Tax=Oratosquilla oratoria TaxID=337810 RepID=UPI003F76D00D